MTFETFREINQVLGVIAFAYLCYRSVRAWPADWAKPDHVWHYRGLLLITSGLTVGASLVAWHYEHTDAPADPVSPFYTSMSVLVLILCWRWPQPRSFLREDSR